jgi:hypothetical protein
MNQQLIHSISRLLIFVFEAVYARQKLMKRGSLWAINDRFEPVFNTAEAMQIENPQPVRVARDTRITVWNHIIGVPGHG